MMDEILYSTINLIFSLMFPLIIKLWTVTGLQAWSITFPLASQMHPLYGRLSIVIIAPFFAHCSRMEGDTTQFFDPESMTAIKLLFPAEAEIMSFLSRSSSRLWKLKRYSLGPRILGLFFLLGSSKWSSPPEEDVEGAMLVYRSLSSDCNEKFVTRLSSSWGNTSVKTPVEKQK